MANTLSAKKRIRQNEKRGARNRAVLSRTRTYVKLALSSIEAKDVNAADQAVKAAIGEIDKAVSKGVLHQNNGARRKSRLMAKYNALKSSSPESKTEPSDHGSAEGSTED